MRKFTEEELEMLDAVQQMQKRDLIEQARKRD